MTRIQYLKGDIFDSKTQVIVNTVNCEGVMGKGLALAFKQKYPDMFRIYQQDCKMGRLRIGRPTLYQESTPWILNFPTKHNWRGNSKLEYLEKGLDFLVLNYKNAKIKSIAFPKLGTQNGKLPWDVVGPLMAKYLSQMDVDVYIYITEGDAEYQYDNEFEVKMWKRFSKIALSPEHLCSEVGINIRDARKLASKRELVEYNSFADVENVEKLAKTSLKKIRDYLNSQKYITPVLTGLSSTHAPRANGTKEVIQPFRQKRKKSHASTEVSADELFHVEKPIS